MIDVPSMLRLTGKAAAVKLQSSLKKEKKQEVYYESIKREPKIKSIYEYRCDERLQTKSKEFTRLPYTGWSWNWNT